MIRKLQQGPCVQYQRDGGWRVGHVMLGMTHGGSNVSLVRESQTGELVLVPSWDLQTYPQSTIPEPGAEAHDEEVWHSADEHPGSDRDVMAEDCDGRLCKAFCGKNTRTWYLYGPGNATRLTRWRELKEGE